MKELTIEEKADRYVEALNRAKNTIEVNQSVPDIVDCVESLFPELAESRTDERIRKGILHLIGCASEIEWCKANVSIGEVQTWLEKQCEQKSADKSDSVLNILNKDNQQVQQENLIMKPSLITVGENEMILNEVISILDNGFMPSSWERARLANGLRSIKLQQTSTWSEEDEEIHRKCICAMRASACEFPKDEKFVKQVNNWLKSLKNRIQSKKEWSEEEQQIIEDAASFILSCVNTAETKKEEERLKELADKLQDLKPHNRWKPSDRDIKLLKELSDGKICPDNYRARLYEIINNLKYL